MSDYNIYKYKNKFSRSSKLRRLVWEFVWLLLFRTTPRWCLNKWRLFLLRLFGAKIGKGCRVLPTCQIWAPWNLEMGESSVLGDSVDCYSMDKIIIGSNVSVSQRSFLCTGSHDTSLLDLPLVTKPIFINDFVWICAESFVGPGVNISEGVIVAAKSVVVKNIDSYSVVAGNPAVKIKNRALDTKNYEGKRDE